MTNSFANGARSLVDTPEAARWELVLRGHV